MLEFLRSKTGGIVAKLFIGLLALSFAVWGISDIFRGGQGQALATVGEQTISEEEFRRTFENQMRSLSQRFGRSISYSDPIAQGLRVQLRNSLIRNAALDEQARKLGLAASQQLVAESIKQNPQLQGPDGKVDPETLRRILAQNGISEAEFEADQRREILDSRERIHQATGTPPRTFSYPNGDFNDEGAAHPERRIPVYD